MSTNKFNANSKKPFCKVCFDAKKPESEYTSHRVRSLPDRNGNTVVTCPVLAATECRYCYQLGHTTKFCSILEENKKKTEKAKSAAIQAQKREERAAAAPKVNVKKDLKYCGAFSALIDNSEDEKEQATPVKVEKAVKVVEDFPTLGDKKAVERANFTRIEKAAEGLYMENRSILHNISTITHPENSWANIAAKPAAPVYKPAPPKIESKVSFTAKSWADYSDSDTEEDDEWDNLPTLTRTSSVYVPSRAIAEDDDW